MVVPTAMSAVGLAALIALPGAHSVQAAGADSEAVPGASSLHVTLESQAGERLRQGDQVAYTIRVRNAGGEDLPSAQVVQFLPPTVDHVSGTNGARVDEKGVSWSAPLEAGERATFHATGEISGVPDGAEQPVVTVCLRPEAGALVTSCTAAVHRVHDAVSPVRVIGGLVTVLVLAVAAGGYLRHRGTRRPRALPATPSNHAPGSVPNIRTFPGHTPVHTLEPRQ